MAGYTGKTILRYTASFTGLGTTPQTTTFAGRTGGPWARGKILRLDVVLDAGPATTFDWQIIEQPAGDVRWEVVNETFPVAFAPSPAPVPYEVTLGSNLEITAQTDDGTFASDVTITMDIEGPY